MSIDVMKQALDALDSDHPDIKLRAAIALRAAIEQAQEPRQWQGLTADEIWACNVAPAGHHVESHICVAHQNVLDFAEAIEAKLREKNS